MFVNNKKIEKPAQILPIKQVVSTNLAIAADQGTPTRMTFRDVYLHEATDYSSNNHVTGDDCGSDHVTENYERIVGDVKTVTRHPVDDALVQRMCLDIASAVHRQISEQTVGSIVSGVTASGTITYQKSEQQQKKQHQKHEQQQQKLKKQQKQKQQQQQKKQHKQNEQLHKLQDYKAQQHKLQQLKEQQNKQQQQQKERHQHEQQQHKQQNRRRHSYSKVSTRPVHYNERKESDIVTIGPEDRYNPSVTEESIRIDHSTSVGVIEESVDDNSQDEDADQSPKVWEVNMVDDNVMLNSAKSHEQQPEEAAATTNAANYDDVDQTS